MVSKEVINISKIYFCYSEKVRLGVILCMLPLVVMPLVSSSFRRFWEEVTSSSKATEAAIRTARTKLPEILVVTSDIHGRTFTQ